MLLARDDAGLVVDTNLVLVDVLFVGNGFCVFELEVTMFSTLKEEYALLALFKLDS